jgi:beta-glucosidase
VGQLPCYYNHKPSRFRNYVLADSSPLFPFGYGLSYSTFEYKNLQISPKQIRPDGVAEVSVDVTNTGKMKGDEILQLYIHDIISLPVRPVMELKDFTRISLNAGETKKVTFKITPDKLEAFNMVMLRTVEPGEFEIMVGKNSADLLKDKLLVK